MLQLVEREVRAPAVMDRRAAILTQDRRLIVQGHLATLLMDEPVRPTIGRGHMKPMQLARHPNAGLVQRHARFMLQVRFDPSLHRLAQRTPTTQCLLNRGAVEFVPIQVLE